MSDEDVMRRAMRDPEVGVGMSPQTPFISCRAGEIFTLQIMGEHAMQSSSEEPYRRNEIDQSGYCRGEVNRWTQEAGSPAYRRFA